MTFSAPIVTNNSCTINMVAFPVQLDAVIDMVRGRMVDNNDNNVENAVEGVVEGRRVLWDTLEINEPPIGPFEERVFDKLITTPYLTSITLRWTLNASDAIVLLRKVTESSMREQLSQILLGFEMTQAQAEMCMSMLQAVPSLKVLTICFAHCSNQVARPLGNFLRQSTCLEQLYLVWTKSFIDEPHDPIIPMPETCMQEICDGIQQSTSLRILLTADSPHDAQTASTLLAGAVGNSQSIAGIGSLERDFAILMRNSLQQMSCVKNFDLCLKVQEFASAPNSLGFELVRDAPWKPLLSQDVPLSYWPRIMAKANGWNKMTSHQPIDVLFFLLKEKNDVLLQNVRRRKIRKRRRYQMSS